MFDPWHAGQAKATDYKLHPFIKHVVANVFDMMKGVFSRVSTCGLCHMQDEDLALARILQEQEQLFMRHLRRSHTDTVRSSDSPTAVSASSTGSPAASARLQQNHDAASSRALSGLGMTSAAEQAPGADEDMEFALRLQEEEDRMHYQHMLQLAGVGKIPPLSLSAASVRYSLEWRVHLDRQIMLDTILYYDAHDSKLP